MLTLIRDRQVLSAHASGATDKPHVVLLLDETASMQKHREKVISTLNEFVQSVKETAKTISLYTFNSQGLHERIFMASPTAIEPLTDKSYIPNWNTPLHDAIGMVMRVFEMSEHKVQMVIHTDGEENCSSEWNYLAVSEFIKRMTERGWLFVYLAEGLTAQAEMAKYQGVKVNFSSGLRGQTMNAMSDITRSYVSNSNAEVEKKTHGGVLDIDRGDKLQ